MSDFRKQVRNHYDAQVLSPEKVAQVLAAGRAVATGNDPVIAFPKRTPWGRYLSLIAALAVFAFLGNFWLKRDANAVSYNELAPRVIEFFDTKSPVVPAPPTKEEVKDWLLSKGAPRQMEIPASLAGLENAACQVLDVSGRKAYLSCYWREQAAERDNSGLIHLLVARAGDFHDQPISAKPVLRELKGWSFASWKKDEVVYTLATAAPPEKLTPFLTVMNPDSLESPFISKVETTFENVALAELFQRTFPGR